MEKGTSINFQESHEKKEGLSYVGADELKKIIESVERGNQNGASIKESSEKNISNFIESKKKIYQVTQQKNGVDLFGRVESDFNINKLLEGNPREVGILSEACNFRTQKLMKEVMSTHYDAVFFAARSAVTDGYIMNGFFSQVSKNLSSVGIEIERPMAMAIWHKLKGITWNVVGQNARTEHYPIFKLIDKRDEDLSEDEKKLKVLAQDIITDTVKKIEIITQRNKDEQTITIGYYDESFDTGITTHRMEEALRDAVHIVNERSTTKHKYEIKELTDRKGCVGGSMSTWAVDKNLERQGILKVTHPYLHQNRQEHRLHQIFMYTAKEYGKRWANMAWINASDSEGSLHKILKNYRINTK